MIVKLLEKYMQDRGYFIGRTKYPEITEYLKEENSCINIIQVVDCKEGSLISNDQFLQQNVSILSSMKKEVHIMNIVFYENLSDAISLVKDEYMCWLIDRQTFSIYDEDNRVEDFYGLRDELNRWLMETKTLLESGNLNAIREQLMNQQEKEVYEKKKLKKPSPVSVTLVIINTIIYLTYFVIGEPFIESGQMDSVLVSQGQIYRFLTAMFLHGGIQHLASNMILLYFMGEMVENKTGSVKYGIIYLISGLMGNVVSYTYELISGVQYVSVGASGAVYGIIGALIYLVLKKTEGLNIQINRLILMVAYCVYSSFATAHVDFAAHLGGLFFGFIITALLCPRGGKR